MRMFSIGFFILLCFLIVNHLAVLEAKKTSLSHESEHLYISGDGSALDDESGDKKEDEDADSLPHTKNCRTITPLIISLIAALSIAVGVIIILIVVVIYLGTKVCRSSRKGTIPTAPNEDRRIEYECLRFPNVSLELTRKRSPNRLENMYMNT